MSTKSNKIIKKKRGVIGHLKFLLSGAITGATEISITYPTEFVKTKMQLYSKYSKMGLVPTFKDTIQKDGVKGLYRGLSVLVSLSAPKTAIRFYSKTMYEEALFEVRLFSLKRARRF